MSATTMRDELQKLRELKDRQAEQAASLSQALIVQAEELQMRLNELQEMHPDGDDMDPETQDQYRQIEDTVNTWEAENMQLSSGIVGPFTANGDAPDSYAQLSAYSRDSTGRSLAPSGSSSAQSRRARNQAHRENDVEFAYEIGSGLLNEVRRLQLLLEKGKTEEQRLAEAKDDLKREIEIVQNALAAHESDAEKFKEENWNLETQLQDVRDQLVALRESYEKLQGEQNKLSKDFQAMTELADKYKNESDQLKVTIEEMKGKSETSHAQHRREIASLQREKQELQSQVKLCKDEADKFRIRAGRSPLPPNGLDQSRPQTPDPSDEDDVFGLGAASNRKRTEDGVEFDDSAPDFSPKLMLGRQHPANELEDTKQRLAHSQRQNNTLKASLQREKEANMQYRRRIEALTGATLLSDGEDDPSWEDFEGDGDETVAPRSRKLSQRAVLGRGRGRGRGRGGRVSSLTQRLNMAAQNPSSDNEDADVTASPSAGQPELDEWQDDDNDDTQTTPVRSPEEQSPSPRTSVDGMDPNFANVLRSRSSSISSVHYSSPLRNSVMARGGKRAAVMGRRMRGGAAFQAVRPPSFSGTPEALAAELGLGAESPSISITQAAAKPETAEFGVQTEPEVAPLPPKPEAVPVPVVPETAEVAIQSDPEARPVPQTQDMAMQTDAEPKVVLVSASINTDAPAPSPVLVQAEAQTPRPATRDIDAQTITSSSEGEKIDAAVSPVRPVSLANSRRDTVTQIKVPGRNVAGDETETELESDAENYHDARQSIVMETPTTQDNDFQSILTVTDNDMSDSDDDDDESIKASRMPSRMGASSSSVAITPSVTAPSTPAVTYDEKAVSADAPPVPVVSKPELKETSVQTDEWVPSVVTSSVAAPPLTRTHTPSLYRVGAPQQFHFVSGSQSAGPTTTSMPISSPPGSPSRESTTIPRPRTSASDRRRSIESTLTSAMDELSRPRVGSSVDKSRPPTMALPPPPRLPPPSNSMPPPNFIPERRTLSASTSSADGPPPRPSSPPPIELIHRATTPTLSSALQVPTRGHLPRSNVSSISHSLAPRPSTTTFRSAANTSAHGPQSSPSGVVPFGRREMSTTSLVSDQSVGSQRSSFSSDHYAERSQARSLGPQAPGPSTDASGRTDPTVIHAITQTMIGEYLYKYTRRAIGKGYGEKRHRRFFWVHPYTKTLYWSSADPGSANVSESSAKSAYIEDVRSVLDPNPMPPGLYQYSVVVSTPSREMKITAQTKERHDIWFNALKYLLSRPSAAASNGAVPPLSPMSGDELSDTGNINSVTASPQNRRSVRPGDSWNHTSRAMHSQSQLSARASFSKRTGTPAAEYLRWAGVPEDHGSPTKSAKSVPAEDEEDLDFELHGDAASDGFEGLENVRACCDGRHTVGRTNGKDHHHHHHRHRHHHSLQEASQDRAAEPNPSDVVRPASPSAWSFRSRASSTQSHDGKGKLPWGLEDKLKFGSKRSTKMTPTASSGIPDQ